MDIQAGEAAVATALADFLETNESTIETQLGPVEIVIENGAVKVADGWFAKLPLGIGALVDSYFAKYAAEIPDFATKYVGIGLDKLVGALRAFAAHVTPGK